MDKDELLKKVRSRQAQLETAREPFGDEYLEIAKYLLPHLEHMDDESQAGARKGKSIYDAYPISRMQLEADGMQGYTASHNITWFRFRTTTPGQMESREVREYLQNLEEHFYYLLQSRSNFYRQAPGFFLHLVGLGTACMFIDEDVTTGEIKCVIPNPWEIYIEKGQYGEIDTVHRKFPQSARNLVTYFNPEDLTDAVKNAAEEAPDKTFELIHCVFPNNDKDFYKSGARDKRFTSVYLQEGGEKLLRRKDSGVDVSGYNVMPYVIARWRDVPYAAYGFGPGHNALPDILTLNLIAKDYTTAVQKNVNPPLTIPKAYKSGISLLPGAKNYSEEEAIEVRPILQNIDLRWAMERIQDLRQRIDEHFMTDFFVMLSSMDKQMTATEIIEKQGEKAASLGPVLSSLHSTFNSMFDRILQIEYEANRLPEPPEELYEQGGNFEIDYMGPLSQAQKRLFETQGTRHFIEHAAPLFQMLPDSMDVLDGDALIKKYADSFGADLDVIRDDKEIMEIRQARAEAMARKEQMEQAERMAKMTGDMGKPVDPSSPLAQVEDQARMSL